MAQSKIENPVAHLDAPPRHCCCSSTINTVTTIFIPCSLSTAFEGASSTEGLPLIFPGRYIIPGVNKAWIKDGGVQRVGATRICKLTDNSEVEETYIQWEHPTAYAYEMTQLAVPLSCMLVKASGSWKFTEEQGGTRIVWTYYGQWTNIFMYPLTCLLVKCFLYWAMNDCLRRLKNVIIEESNQKNPVTSPV